MNEWWRWSFILPFYCLCLGIRLFLLNPVGYRSTDFEVHRNWMAIAYSLPFSRWYQEATSPWTLDYPPFFGWLEKLLAYVATYVDQNMLVITNLNYSAHSVIIFQRLSVIALDALVFIPGVLMLLSALQNVRSAATTVNVKDKLVPGCLIALNVGLLVVDHIHFQYNGFLLGLLFISLSFFVKQQFLFGILVFSALVYFKHIFVYTAPILGFFVLQEYCFKCKCSTLYEHKDRSATTRLPSKTIHFPCVMRRSALAFGVGCFVSLAALLPVLVTGQKKSFIARLFPFGRGLVHSYWAPNFWALYLFVDRVLLKMNYYLGLTKQNSLSFSSLVSPTAGKISIGISITRILPTVTPRCALLMTVFFGYAPLLYATLRLFARCSQRQRLLYLPLLVALSNYVGFLLSWHVHEKAILYTTLPLSFLVYTSESVAAREHFWLLNAWANASILPLLPNPTDLPLKLALWGLGTYMEYASVTSHFILEKKSDALPPQTPLSSGLRRMELLYILCLVIYQGTWSSVHGVVFANKTLFEFLPLLLTSVSASIAIFLHLMSTVVMLLRSV